jgi:hypothetical protein
MNNVGVVERKINILDSANSDRQPYEVTKFTDVTKFTKGAGRGCW